MQRASEIVQLLPGIPIPCFSLFGETCLHADEIIGRFNIPLKRLGIALKTEPIFSNFRIRPRTYDI